MRSPPARKTPPAARPAPCHSARPIPASVGHRASPGSRPRTRNTRLIDHGFTLLEIALVILIIALAMGALVPMFGTGLESESLRRTAADFEKAARTARALAIESGYPSEVLLDRKSFALRAHRASRDEEGVPIRVEQDYPLAAGTTWQVRTWLRERWRTPDKECWVFQPSGLVEPLTARFARAEAFIELTFNPLTGEPEQEKYHFP